MSMNLVYDFANCPHPHDDLTCPEGDAREHLVLLADVLLLLFGALEVDRLFVL